MACLAETQRLNVKDNAAARGAQMHAGLLALMGRHEAIGNIRGGHGLMHAIELVADRTTKKPADKAVPAKVQASAYKAGAMVRVSGNNIILSPPLILTEADVNVILSAIDTGLSAI